MSEHLRGVRPGSRGGIEIRWSVDGVARSRYLAGPATPARLAQAARLRGALVADTAAGRGEPMTVSRAAEAFLRSAQPRLAQSTLTAYRRRLTNFWLPALGEVPLALLTVEQVRSVLDRAGLKPATAVACVQPLRQVLRYARLERRWLRGDVLKDLWLGRGQRPVPDPLTPDEVGRVLAALSGEAQVYFRLALETGLRAPSELLGLQWRDFDGESLTVSRALVAGVLQPRTKTGTVRTVWLKPETVALLTALRATRRGVWLFTAGRGRVRKRADCFNRAWKRALAAAGVRYRPPYQCRHTYASIALAAGHSPGFIAKQLGHSLQMFYSTYARYIERGGERLQLGAWRVDGGGRINPLFAL